MRVVSNHLAELVQHVETWVEPIDNIHARWLFRFNGQADRTIAYDVLLMSTPAGDQGQLHAYVVEVPTATARGWPLSNLDYTIRDRDVLISDVEFAQRLAEMTNELVIHSFRALALG